MYDYLFFDAATGTAPFPRAVPVVKPLLAAALGGAPAEVVGVFAAQLGWTGTQAAALLRCCLPASEASPGVARRGSGLGGGWVGG